MAHSPSPVAQSPSCPAAPSPPNPRAPGLQMSACLGSSLNRPAPRELPVWPPAYKHAGLSHLKNSKWHSSPGPRAPYLFPLLPKCPSA